MNLALLLLLVSPQQEDVVAIKGGRIQTVSRGVIEDGVILIQSGLIVKVGKSIDLPLEAKVIDVGKNGVITPGFIDAHSHLGSVFEVDEFVEAMTPNVRAVDAFSSDHADVERALSSGVTMILLAPGNANLVSGRAGFLRLIGGRLDKMILRDSGPLKVSLTGEALFRDREPTSKSGALQVLRKSGLLKSSELVMFHARSADEIQRAIALKQEFGLRAYLVHGDEADRVLEEIKNADLPVAVGPLMADDTRDKLEMPGKLARAGVRIAFVSDAPASDEAHLRISAALAIRHGLDKVDALRALTLGAAEILGVQDVAGSVDEGKFADLVIWGGEPLSLSSTVQFVIVGGKVVYQGKK